MSIALLIALQMAPVNSPIVIGPEFYSALSKEACPTEPKSERDSMVCEYQAFSAADRELNAVYGKLLQATHGKVDPDPSIGGADQTTLVVAAQKAWLIVRDDHCLALGINWSGGHGRAAAEFSCLTRATEARTVQLRELLL